MSRGVYFTAVEQLRGHQGPRGGALVARTSVGSCVLRCGWRAWSPLTQTALHTQLQAPAARQPKNKPASSLGVTGASARGPGSVRWQRPGPVTAGRSLHLSEPLASQTQTQKPPPARPPACIPSPACDPEDDVSRADRTASVKQPVVSHLSLIKDERSCGDGCRLAPLSGPGPGNPEAAKVTPARGATCDAAGPRGGRGSLPAA